MDSRNRNRESLWAMARRRIYPTQNEHWDAVIWCYNHHSSCCWKNEGEVRVEAGRWVGSHWDSPVEREQRLRPQLDSQSLGCWHLGSDKYWLWGTVLCIAGHSAAPLVCLLNTSNPTHRTTSHGNQKFIQTMPDVLCLGRGGKGEGATLASFCFCLENHKLPVVTIGSGEI